MFDLDAPDKEHVVAMRCKEHGDAIGAKETAIQSMSTAPPGLSLLSESEGQLQRMQSALQIDSKRLGKTHTTARFSRCSSSWTS